MTDVNNDSKNKESVFKDLEPHITAHNLGNNENNQFKASPDKVSTPETTDLAMENEWDHFVAPWRAYKRATGLKDHQISVQLLHWPTELWQRRLFLSRNASD